jgi:tetratricopeptide (TPR) repeat protein
MTAVAESWFRRGAAAGHPDAMDGLGWLLSQQPHGGTEGEAWLLRAIEVGSSNACCNLAVVRERQLRQAEATELYRRAAQAGHVTAMSNLAWSLDQSDELVEAEHWYRRAAAQNNARAMSNLGWLLERQGKASEAEQWFTKGAATGDGDAIHALGAMYGRTGNERLAYHWYATAADAGSKIAAEKLARGRRIGRWRWRWLGPDRAEARLLHRSVNSVDAVRALLHPVHYHCAGGDPGRPTVRWARWAGESLPGQPSRCTPTSLRRPYRPGACRVRTAATMTFP